MLFVVWKSHPLQIFSAPFQCSWSHQHVQQIFLFYFACFIKIVVVCWDKSQPQTVGCLAAECNSIVPSWEDLVASNEGLQRQTHKVHGFFRKMTFLRQRSWMGCCTRGCGFYKYSEPLEVHQCTRHCGVSRGCRHPQAAVIADLCFSISQHLWCPGTRLVLRRGWDGFLPGLIIILIVISFSYQISIIPSVVGTCECVIWVTHYQIALVTDLLADWYWWH